MSSRLLAAALCALTIAAYSNSFTGGFPFDNKQLILQDARVHDVSRANLDLILGHSYWWPYGESGLYRPVTTLSYLFNYALLGNGNRPAGYHAFNLAVHVVNVLLVYALLLALLNQAGAGPPFKGRRPAHGAKAASGRNRMGGPAASTSSNPAPAAPGFARVPAAFATAAIWAVHPLSTEAVTNIVGRADLLAALAVLGAFLLYLKARGEAGPRRLAWFAGVAAASALGFFSKESAVVIVPVIALYELVWWDGTRSRSALIWAAASLAAPLLLMWSQRSAVLGSSPAAEFAFVDNPIVGAGFWTGRLSAIAVMARYLALLVWPATLSNDYSYAQVPIVHGTARDCVACLAIAACAAGWLALSPWRARRNPGVVLAQRVAFFSAAFAFVTFLPASNLLFPTGTIMAERLMYLPSIGLVALLAIALLAAAARVFGSPGLAILAVAVLASGLSYRTWTRNPDWRDDVALWTSAVHAAPSSAKAHRALAEALYDTDPSHAHIDRVIAEAERSVALLSPLPDRWNSYQSYRQAGAYYLDKAVALRQRAADGDARAAGNAALADRAALPLLKRCLAIVRAAGSQIAGASAEPEADASRLLAAAYLGLDDGAGALAAASRARDLSPLHPLAYRLAADALLVQRRPDEAAVTLMTGSIVTDDAGLGQALMGLYRSGLDESGCAVVATANGPALNPVCPLVQRHFCQASVVAAEVNLRLGRRDRAERARAFAATDPGCR